jgi:hypothetical protein
MVGEYPEVSLWFGAPGGYNLAAVAPGDTG